MFKKIISLTLCAALLVLAACSVQTEAPEWDEKRLKIVCTLFPMYDWVMNVLGDKAQDADVTLLLDNGVDLHSYQPTADDMIKIAGADVFVYVGGESDKWVNDIASTTDVSGVTFFGLLDNLGDAVVEEEIVEGMEAEDAHEHDEDAHEHDEDAHEHDEDAHEHDEDAHGEEEAEYDEHVWLSLKNAAALCTALGEVIGEKDAENAAVYGMNAENYAARLNELNGVYAEKLAGAAKDTLVVCDRFPFRYLCDDFGLNYFAAFSGCSAESEAAFSTITFLADKVNALSLDSVIITETADGRIADTVISTADRDGVKVLTLNAMQSVTADKIAGTSYYEIMKGNLETLTQALS